MSYFVYILECSNGAYYTGYTNDIVRRYQEHCDGSPKCKYTRSFPPKRLAACWKINADVSLALRVEKAIKSLSKTHKMKLTDRSACLISHLLERGYNKETVDLIGIE